jgi:RHS repeat-associated protein
MQSAEVQALSESLLAATPQLSEKPRLGFESKKTTGKPGSSVCNFTVTLGLRATVVENGVRKTYRARYYNPTTGRFLSEDPLGFAGSGTNLYAYAAWNPISNKDPLGLCANALSTLSKCAAIGLLSGGGAYELELLVLTAMAMYSAIILMVEFAALIAAMSGPLGIGLMFLELSAIFLDASLVEGALIPLVIVPILTVPFAYGLCQLFE